MSNEIRKNPPRIATSILEILLSPEHNSVLGDMEEEYHDRLLQKGAYVASIVYWLQTAKLLPVLIYHNTIWGGVMLKNYLKVTLRNLRKYKGYSVLNIFGLSFKSNMCRSLHL